MKDEIIKENNLINFMKSYGIITPTKRIYGRINCVTEVLSWKLDINMLTGCFLCIITNNFGICFQKNNKIEENIVYGSYSDHNIDIREFMKYKNLTQYLNHLYYCSIHKYKKNILSLHTYTCLQSDYSSLFITIKNQSLNHEIILYHLNNIFPIKILGYFKINDVIIQLNHISTNNLKKNLEQLLTRDFNWNDKYIKKIMSIE